MSWGKFWYPVLLRRPYRVGCRPMPHPFPRRRHPALYPVHRPVNVPVDNLPCSHPSLRRSLHPLRRPLRLPLSRPLLHPSHLPPHRRLYHHSLPQHRLLLFHRWLHPLCQVNNQHWTSNQIHQVLVRQVGHQIILPRHLRSIHPQPRQTNLRIIHRRHLLLFLQ